MKCNNCNGTGIAPNTTPVMGVKCDKCDGGNCPERKFDYSEIYISKQAMENIKKWDKEVEEDIPMDGPDSAIDAYEEPKEIILDKKKGK